MAQRIFSLFLFTAAFCTIAFLESCSSSQDRISYNEHIRPIFNKNCLACHGGVKQLGGFSLLFREEALGETESGQRAIVPGNARKSELYQRIIHTDPEMRMPLEHEPLSKTEIDLIAQWIDQGAEWEEHWAYVPPQAVQVPKTDSDWAKQPIDHFILAKLESEGLRPEVPADPYTLARRLSLDLTGLPPKPEWIAEYTANPTAENYEKLVDTLLQSPHFGERWAAMWLDLARYADSKGYEKDPYRDIWPYRDWVIDAFNQNMPFKQFTIEQIAGDLIPEPSKEQLIATAFHRNSMTNTEGGTSDEEYRIAAIIDRVNTTFEVWMGTTISCVQCHAHPYDPFTQKEYYEAFAVFNNTKDNDLDNEYPNLNLYEPEAEEDIEEIIAFIQQLEPSKDIAPEMSLDQQIRQALFPRLVPEDCDELENVILHGRSSLSNWSSNVNEQKNKKFYFRYDNISLDGLKAIKVQYNAKGDDARLELRLDSKDNPVVAALDFKKTGINFWNKTYAQWKEMQLEAQSGTHDLVFEIINTSGAFATGVVNISELELNYEKEKSKPSSIRQKQEALLAIRNKSAQIPITLERKNSFQRATNVFIRGNFLDKGDLVAPGVPHVLHAMNDEDAPRLAFAKWLVSEDNPLTARVMVNRFWEQLFGNGIIESLEDLGTQGLAASHPELLDYLALQFMHAHEWRVKDLLKEIVQSAAYQQNSRVSIAKLEKDPYNQFLSRGARIRLSSEQIRDQALAVSGLLHDSIGGKSVMPPQPEGIWQVTYNNQAWKTEEDENRHRRGLYTYWRRTSPYPSMIAFDSPSREFCSSRRIRTNTPLQALVTLNDPVYIEAAEALAKSMMEVGKGDLRTAITFGYSQALIKAPDEESIAILEKLYNQAAAEFDNTKPVARTISYEKENSSTSIKDPMTVVANAILNLDGFLMKE